MKMANANIESGKTVLGQIYFDDQADSVLKEIGISANDTLFGLITQALAKMFQSEYNYPMLVSKIAKTKDGYQVVLCHSGAVYEIKELRIEPNLQQSLPIIESVKYEQDNLPIQNARKARDILEPLEVKIHNAQKTNVSFHSESLHEINFDQPLIEGIYPIPAINRYMNTGRVRNINIQNMNAILEKIADVWTRFQKVTPVIGNLNDGLGSHPASEASEYLKKHLGELLANIESKTPNLKKVAQALSVLNQEVSAIFVDLYNEQVRANNIKKMLAFAIHQTVAEIFTKIIDEANRKPQKERLDYIATELNKEHGLNSIFKDFLHLKTDGSGASVEEIYQQLATYDFSTIEAKLANIYSVKLNTENYHDSYAQKLFQRNMDEAVKSYQTTFQTTDEPFKCVGKQMRGMKGATFTISASTKAIEKNIASLKISMDSPFSQPIISQLDQQSREVREIEVLLNGFDQEYPRVKGVITNIQQRHAAISNVDVEINQITNQLARLDRFVQQITTHMNESNVDSPSKQEENTIRLAINAAIEILKNQKNSLVRMRIDEDASEHTFQAKEIKKINQLVESIANDLNDKMEQYIDAIRELKLDYDKLQALNKLHNEIVEVQRESNTLWEQHAALFAKVKSLRHIPEELQIALLSYQQLQATIEDLRNRNPEDTLQKIVEDQAKLNEAKNNFAKNFAGQIDLLVAMGEQVIKQAQYKAKITPQALREAHYQILSPENRATKERARKDEIIEAVLYTKSQDEVIVIFKEHGISSLDLTEYQQRKEKQEQEQTQAIFDALKEKAEKTLADLIADGKARVKGLEASFISFTMTENALNQALTEFNAARSNPYYLHFKAYHFFLMSNIDRSRNAINQFNNAVLAYHKLSDSEKTSDRLEVLTQSLLKAHKQLEASVTATNHLKTSLPYVHECLNVVTKKQHTGFFGSIANAIRTAYNFVSAQMGIRTKKPAYKPASTKYLSTFLPESLIVADYDIRSRLNGDISEIIKDIKLHLASNYSGKIKNAAQLRKKAEDLHNNLLSALQDSDIPRVMGLFEELKKIHVFLTKIANKENKKLTAVVAKTMPTIGNQETEQKGRFQSLSLFGRGGNGRATVSVINDLQDSIERQHSNILDEILHAKQHIDDVLRDKQHDTAGLMKYYVRANQLLDEAMKKYDSTYKEYLRANLNDCTEIHRHLLRLQGINNEFITVAKTLHSIEDELNRNIHKAEQQRENEAEKEAIVMTYIAEEFLDIEDEAKKAHDDINELMSNAKKDFTTAFRYTQDLDLLITSFSSFIPDERDLDAVQAELEKYVLNLKDIGKSLREIKVRYENLSPEKLVVFRDEISDDINALNSRLRICISQLQNLYISQMQNASSRIQEDFETERTATLEYYSVLQSIQDKGVRSTIDDLTRNAEGQISRITERVTEAIKNFNQSVTSEKRIQESFQKLRSVGVGLLSLGAIKTNLQEILNDVASQMEVKNIPTKHRSSKLLTAISTLPKILRSAVKSLKRGSKASEIDNEEAILPSTRVRLPSNRINIDLDESPKGRKEAR